MIMPDDDIVCREERKDFLGYLALFEVGEDSELSEGVVLCAVIKGTTYMFQIEETTNVLTEGSVRVMQGTLFEVFIAKPCDLEVDYFTISNCRFPTRDELEWYNKMDTV